MECDNCVWKLIMDDKEARKVADYPSNKCPGYNCLDSNCSGFDSSEEYTYKIAKGAYYGAQILKK